MQMNEADEIKPLQREVTLLRKRLSDAESELQDFLYIISHDFKGPLRAIMSSCMILREDYESRLDSAGMAELKRQSDAARKLNKMMEELLKISRLNRQEVRPSQLDLGGLFRRVAEINGLDESHVTVHGELDAHADRELVALLFQNLIDNSIKFSKPDQPPRLTLGKNEDGFFLRDDGIGVDPERSHRAFLPFEKLNGDDYPGFGMGLTACKRIVDRHHGTLSLTGQPGEGATVQFSFGV